MRTFRIDSYVRALLAAFAFSVFTVGCAEPADTSEAMVDGEGVAPESEATAAMEADIPLPETNYFRIDSEFGSIVVKLYDETPLHRDNFKKLAAGGFYDSTTFHRVMSQFMIQGGDPLSKDGDPSNDGSGGPGYTIPSEFSPELIHKKGALAAARQPDQVNPERQSSGSQFYIVQGRVLDDAMLEQIELGVGRTMPGFTIPTEAREVYKAIGGAPFLDQQYTVYGEVVEGLDVVDAIAAIPTVGPPTDRPLNPPVFSVSPVNDYGE